MGDHPTLDPHAPQPNMQSLASSARASSQGGRQPAETPGSSHESSGTRVDLVPWAQQTGVHAGHEESQARAGAATQTLMGKPLTFLPPSGSTLALVPHPEVAPGGLRHPSFPLQQQQQQQ